MKRLSIGLLAALTVVALLLSACAQTETPPDPNTLAHAGQLYDKWWTEAP